MLADSQLIMLKLEGGKFAAQTPFLTGKTFTVLKTSGAVGGAGKWLFLQPVGDAAAAVKDVVVLKVQHGAGQLSWLVGKTFTIGKAPLVAGGNASKYLVLHPASGLAVKSVTGAAVAAKGMTAARVVEGVAAKSLAPTLKTVAFQATGAGVAPTTSAAITVGKTAAASTIAKSAATAGTIWIGSGIGLGAGAASPVVIGALIVATGIGIYQYKKRRAVNRRNDDEFADVLL